MAPPPEHGERPPPRLPDELFGEILLRLPPAEPECLFRATLVCKPWRRLITADRSFFLRRYREFHRAPPTLGFLCNSRGVAHFAPTTAFSPPHDPDFLPYSCVLDCRHGRALIGNPASIRHKFLVWDPVTGDKRHVRNPDAPRAYCKAAVLCAAAGCDHLDCHGGPFLVALFETFGLILSARVYSSKSGKWSDATHLQLDGDDDGHTAQCVMPSALVGDALYFECCDEVLRYELGGDRRLSLIHRPAGYDNGTALMLMEDGGLGLAGLDGFTLHRWSLKMGPTPDRVAGWEKLGAVNLEMLHIGDLSKTLYLIGSGGGCDSNVVFVRTDACVFMVDLRSVRITKVCEKDKVTAIFPYRSFYTPDTIVRRSCQQRIDISSAPVTCYATEPLNDLKWGKLSFWLCCSKADSVTVFYICSVASVFLAVLCKAVPSTNTCA